MLLSAVDLSALVWILLLKEQLVSFFHSLTPDTSQHAGLLKKEVQLEGKVKHGGTYIKALRDVLYTVKLRVFKP